MKRAVALVLWYLAGCTNEPKPLAPLAGAADAAAASAVPDSAIEPDVTVASDVASRVGDAPDVVAAADAGKPKKKFPKTCFQDKDCGDDAFCVLPFNGANFEKGKPGHCSKEPPIYEGRPLVIDGVSRVAEGLDGATAEEHASIAAFARTIAALLALGAPHDLIEKTSRALHDEIRHAHDAWAGDGPGPLPAAIAPFPSLETLPVELVIDVFRGGCLGETHAVARALSRGDLVVADDEARHAALAFETVRWLGGRFPAASVALDRELRLCTDPSMAPLVAWASLGCSDERAALS